MITTNGLKNIDLMNRALLTLERKTEKDAIKNYDGYLIYANIINKYGEVETFNAITYESDLLRFIEDEMIYNLFSYGVNVTINKRTSEININFYEISKH